MIVKVKVMPDEDTGKLIIKVNLKSLANRDITAQQIVQIESSDTPLTLTRKVQLAGGAVAEYLGEKYNDCYDPVLTSQQAVNAFRSELLLINRLKQSAKDKAKLISNYVARLSSNDFEVYDLIKFKLDRNLEVTQAESTALDKIVQYLHSKDLL